MRQKLGLVLALAHRPSVVILDEPTASLDPLMQGKLHAELRGLAAGGSCVFLSSHTLDEVEKLCERVAIIREGRIVADEPIERLRARARRVVTLHWKNGAPPETAGLDRIVEIHDRGPNRWRGKLIGSAMDLARWSSSQPITDLSIEEPDLSELFHDFYR